MAANTPITIVSSTSMSAKYAFTLRLGGVAGPEPALGGVAGSEPAERGVAGPEPAEPAAAVSPGPAGSASCHDARMTTGMSTAVMPIRTSAMPSTPTA